MSWQCRSTHWSCRRPCRGLCRAQCHAQGTISLLKGLPPVTIQKLYRDPEPMLHTYWAVSRVARCVAHALGRIVGRWALCRALCHDTRPPSCDDTNNCIATHPSGQAPRARCCSPSSQADIVAAPLGRITGPCHGAAARHCAPARSCGAWPCTPTCVPRPCLS